MEEVMPLILNYMDTYLYCPKSNWPEYEFKKRSYSRWAVTEIIQMIFKNPNKMPEEIIQEFIFKMNRMMNIREPTKDEYGFSTAKETAEDILFLVSDNKKIKGDSI